MKVNVRIDPRAMPSYLAWRRRMIHSPTGGRDMADLQCLELFRELARMGGVPQGASSDKTFNPERWSWRFSADTLIVYEIVDHPRSLFRKLTRNVRITAIIEIHEP